MQVCIAEKPSVAAEIARVLGADRRNNGYFEGNGYCVTWTFGHLCELKEPHDYDPTLRRWDMQLLPILPPKFGIKLKGDNGIKKQFDVIKRLYANAECIINCGDAGQEGELIQRWVMQLAGVHCPVYRLWISSLTEEAIRDGFNNLKPSADFNNLYAAGSARAMGDWLLGMNATRAYTIRYAGRGMVLSIGRVQTPTLALIVQRYKEIANFKPEKYWELKTKYRDVIFSATSGKFNKIEEGQAALEKIKDAPFQIDDVKAKQGKEAPPALFDLTSLQVECNNKLGLSADETLRIAQSLYENKFTTYPRVDTRFLTDDIYAKVPAILKGLVPYSNLTAQLLSGAKLPKSKRVFNNLKVTDHHAIIPTGAPPSPSMSLNEKRVYDMIARRFIANFYPDSIVLLTTVLGSASGVQFKVNGKQIQDPGWRVVYGNQKIDDDKDEQGGGVLPEFNVGESGPHEPSLQEKQTTPPKPYTEATLLRAMETAGKQVDDGELRELMKENGIGRPSTRAAIIETLFRRKYIVKERKSLQPTINGIRLIDTISSPLLKSVELTGQWERKLRQIENGEYTAANFKDEMAAMVTEVVNIVRNDYGTQRFQAIQEQPKSAAKSSSRAPKVSETGGGEAAQASAKPAAKSSTAKSSTAKSKQMLCPKCGKPILTGKSAWGCSGFREGCHFVVPFVVMEKKLTETQVSALLSKGETATIKGIVVNGEKKDGKLAFDKDFNIVYREAEPAKSAPDAPLHCPLCGNEIVKGKTAWGCMGYKSGCSFRVPFQFMCKKLTPTHLKVLVSKKCTAKMTGFVDEHGVQRSGQVVLTPDGQLALKSAD